MNRLACIATAFATMAAAPAVAQDCTAPSADPYDMDDAAISALYDCMEAAMAEGYAKEGDPIATAYRGWAVTGTRPGVAGVHGDRLLLTFANDAAADTYMQYADEGVVMPAGSILAKESIKIGKEGKASIGPLFLMTKLDAGAAPETGDWLYGGIQPNGKEMKVQQSFCHDCHVAYEAQDMLAYPLEEVRISAGN